MSEYRDHNSLYENSDYPSRRQAPRASEQGGTPQKRRRRRRRGGVRRGIGIFFKVLGTLILVGLCTGALICCFAAVYINEVIVPQADLNPDDFTRGENSVMYYTDKSTGQNVEMTTLFNVTSSVWVDYEDMPEDLINATVAIEDKRFWTHPGVDWKRTAKAVLDMFLGNDISGGSTITQQLIKNMTQYNETTVKRKIIEIVRAFRFTQNNSKEDTLEYYLNIIPLGSRCEGVGAAALEYFGKPVSELTLAECASLISITNNPSKYGPYSFSKSPTSEGEMWNARQWNKYRQEIVLWRMKEDGYISQAEYEEAVAQELNFVRAEGQGAATDIYTWYEETVISDVRDALAKEYSWSAARANQALQSGGLRIYTCFDPDAQAIVDEVYTNRENLDYTSSDGQQMQSAICVIDNSSGDIVAIAGQFGDKTINLGSNYANGGGNRQPGSSFKPLAVYSPALEFSKINPYSVFDDYPYRMMGNKAWPLNSGTTRYQGLLTVREALKQSLNTVAVRIISDRVTPEESFKFVQDRFHIDLEEGRMINGQWMSDIDVAPMAMGGLTNGTNVREMAAAFSTFPNNGYYTGSRTFTKVTQLVDGKEVTLLENILVPEPVIKDSTAYYINDMLQGVFDAGGTASDSGIPGQHAAGKTGTTSSTNDRWFVGYTNYYTAAVWTGYERSARMGNSAVKAAVNLWEKVMVPLHEGLPDKSFPDPKGRRDITYCLDSGLLAGEYCAMDPRGNRAAKGSVFPGDYPEGLVCTAHTEASVITVCLDCPVLKEDGTPTGLYYQAGPYCPEDRQQQICLPDYEREQLGSAVAGDDMWRFESAASYGVCTLHTEPQQVEPDPLDPNQPLDPSNPDDPNAPYYPFTPDVPGGTDDPGQTGGSSEPSGPVIPLDPLPPSRDIFR